ncbi:hypothetical protein [Lentilactobacillus kefiri]|uniref:SCP domain-containing protein n=2 Tax=Lentilactobacillus kefiri TaxID=33962 RepID=A0A8E1RK07_LENKE|nr:hypothetical protein [Lentilactobacillus kefiri]KRL72732.1 hypothetical protein FD08_GL003531 [Lentilactobacillus parakefiri DSM 10551]KRM52719.1 hypothetical protein FC95_GL001172 [Lentilactobacillus kefiri DSM 20587 = JCM 5818]MCJ2161372.1 hypothetical protein [Lentilactobacillus kefiri]MCP9368648.1 hypothetical protein [Lentilactobacillus kefiri]MDH5107995.1 hypothetical protein [Lentilactobacillus kefiri]
MKSTSKLLTILSLSLGLIGASAFGINAQAKTTTVNYVSTTGKVLRAPITYTTKSTKSSYYYNPKASYPTSGAGYIKKIPGYLPHKVPQTYSASNMPTSLNVTYIKESTLAKKVDKQYLKQINAYRKTKGLKAFKHNASLKAKTVVRSKELWQKLSHVRPNGQSYNSNNSGYAECMAVLPAYFLPTGITTYNSGQGAILTYNSNGYVSYKKTAKTASHELLTCDALHRDTELNNWATYSEVAFSFHDDGSAKMAQLFEMANNPNTKM